MSSDHTLYDAQELFEQVARGDESAFTKVFYQYNQKIYPYLLKKVHSEAIAREMVQDVFLRLWMFREKLHNLPNAEAYLFRMAANLLQDYYRRVGREMKMKSAWGRKEEGQQVIENDVWQSETRRLLDEAVHQLPVERRKVYQLRLQGYSYDEIADTLGISIHTVRNQLTTATKAIKEILRDKGLSALVLIILWKGL